VECIQAVEAQREIYKKKPALKCQLVLNNYGLLLSHLEAHSALYALAGKQDEQSVLAEVRQSFEYHAEAFSTHVWKEARAAIKLGLDDPA
jgi:hypothetical protein